MTGISGINPTNYEADYFVSGTENELEVVRKLVEEVDRKFGIKGTGGLCVPLGMIMMILVGTPYYEGMVTSLDTLDPGCTIIHVETEKKEELEALLNALREAFSYLKVDMKKI